MIKTRITWRKATEEELKSGSPEMIKVSEEEIDLPYEEEPKIDLSNIDIDSLSDDQINKLKTRFGL